MHLKLLGVYLLVLQHIKHLFVLNNSYILSQFHNLYYNIAVTVLKRFITHASATFIYTHGCFQMW